MKKNATVHRRFMTRLVMLPHSPKAGQYHGCRGNGYRRHRWRRQRREFGFQLLTECPCRTMSESRSQSFHALHGYASLPDILWKARLGPFIETHREFRYLLRKASTTRSAKKSNEGFVNIATTLLSLEILASGFADWSALYPLVAPSRAGATLKGNARASHMPLMEFFIFTRRSISVRLRPPRLRRRLCTPIAHPFGADLATTPAQHTSEPVAPNLSQSPAVYIPSIFPLSKTSIDFLCSRSARSRAPPDRRRLMGAEALRSWCQ